MVFQFQELSFGLHLQVAILALCQTDSHLLAGAASVQWGSLCVWELCQADASEPQCKVQPWSEDHERDEP